MFGMTVELAVEEPLIAHVVRPKMLGKLFTALAVYETVTVRTRPLLTMFIDGVGVAESPGRLAAVALKTFCAVAVTTVLFCAIIAGVTAAMAAASTAAFNCNCLRYADV